MAAHEVGHTLGFQHNMKASSLYPVEKVRDRGWVRTMSHTPTLMDYSRFNYVAQPEDKIAPADLIPKIGPYDRWATTWGYKPIPGATSPDDEKKTLDEWARIQDSTPYLRFSTANSRGSEPGEQSEAVGDADAIAATALGIKNLERVADMLIPATVRPAEDFGDLAEVYDRLVGQWTLELNHVVPIVGGFSSQQKSVSQPGVVFTPLPLARQAAEPAGPATRPAEAAGRESARDKPSLFTAHPRDAAGLALAAEPAHPAEHQVAAAPAAGPRPLAAHHHEQHRVHLARRSRRRQGVARCADGEARREVDLSRRRFERLVDACHA